MNALQWAGAFQRLSTVRGVSKLSTILPHMMKKWGLPLRKLIVSFIIVGSLQFAALSPQAQAQSDSRHAATVVDLEIAPAELDKFLAALKENGAATIKESGCLQYNILQSPTNPNQVFVYELYQDDAAVQAHRSSDHFKKYVATTKDMVLKRQSRPMASVELYSKAK